MDDFSIRTETITVTPTDTMTTTATQTDITITTSTQTNTTLSHKQTSRPPQQTPPLPPQSNTSATITTDTPDRHYHCHSYSRRLLQTLQILIDSNTASKDTDTTTADTNTTNDPSRLNIFRHFETFSIISILLALTKYCVFNYVDESILDIRNNKYFNTTAGYANRT